MSQYFDTDIKLRSSIAASLIYEEIGDIFTGGYRYKSIERSYSSSKFYKCVGWEDEPGHFHTCWLYFDIWGHPITYSIRTFACDFDHTATHVPSELSDVASAVLKGLKHEESIQRL